MKVIHIDVSELPAPEPLQKIFETLKKMPEQHILKVNHRKLPRLLYKPLTQQGYKFHVQPGKHHAYDIFIWKSTINPPENLTPPNLANDDEHLTSSLSCEQCNNHSA